METSLADVNINNHNLAIKEYKGQRVVTLSDIDAVHERQNGAAKKNFQNNKSHFILNEDYFEITRKEFGAIYAPNEIIIGNPNLTTYLFTESGYLMIAKSFTDDLAWDIQRTLVKSYFKLKEIKSTVSHPTSSTPLDREELAAYMIYNGQIIEAIREENSTMLANQTKMLESMTTIMSKAFEDMTSLFSSLADVVKEQQKTTSFKVISDTHDLKDESIWKQTIFTRMNKFALEHRTVPAKLFGMIYRQMIKNGTDVNQYIKMYANDIGNTNSSVINAIAHYTEARVKFEEEMEKLFANYSEITNTDNELYQNLLKLPKEIADMIECLKPRYGKSTSAVMRKVYPEFEKVTGLSLDDLAANYAKKIGANKCSKSLPISEDKKLMKAFKNVVKNMKEAES